EIKSKREISITFFKMIYLFLRLVSRLGHQNSSSFYYRCIEWHKTKRFIHFLNRIFYLIKRNLLRRKEFHKTRKHACFYILFVVCHSSLTIPREDETWNM